MLCDHAWFINSSMTMVISKTFLNNYIILKKSAAYLTCLYEIIYISVHTFMILLLILIYKFRTSYNHKIMQRVIQFLDKGIELTECLNETSKRNRTITLTSLSELVRKVYSIPAATAPSATEMITRLHMIHNLTCFQQHSFIKRHFHEDVQKTCSLRAVGKLLEKYLF